MNEALFFDRPDCPGAANVLRRAKQLSQLRWIPVKPLPAVFLSTSPEPGGSTYANINLPAWRPRTGVVYSSVRLHEKYVGYNVLPETYLSALANPNSCLYRKSLHGKGVSNCGAYYGTVCSEFVSYCFALPLRCSCIRWPEMEGVQRIGKPEAEELRLCDIILNPKRHVALVTGIGRDASGRVRQIEVTESYTPNIIASTFTAEEFMRCYLQRSYEIYRYNRVAQVTYTPDPCVHVEGDPDLPYPVPNGVLLPDFGNKANYLPSEPVELSVFDEACLSVRVRKDGETVRELPISEGIAVLKDAEPGFYTACGLYPDGAESDCVEFCITGAEVKTDKTVYRAGEEIVLTASCAADDPAVACVVKQWNAPFSDRGEALFPDGKAGEAVLRPLPAGEYAALSFFRNRYGLYTSERVPFTVTE